MFGSLLLLYDFEGLKGSELNKIVVLGLCSALDQSSQFIILSFHDEIATFRKEMRSYG